MNQGLVLHVSLLVLVSGCHSAQSQGSGGDTDTDVDSDTDADTDSDADTDTGPFECVVDLNVDPVEWALPPVPDGAASPQVFNRWVNFWGECDPPENDWASTVSDFDGDGARDIFVLNMCDLSAVGTDQWQVYENLGDSFAQDPSQVALPDAPALEPEAEPFVEIFQGLGPLSCVDEEHYFGAVLEPMDGDDAWDLVVLDDCAPGGTGETHWLVYYSTGFGFEDTPVTWDLPAAPELFLEMTYPNADPFVLLSAQCLDGGEWEYHIVNLDGDEYADLVVTDHCDVAGVGDSHWEVHLGGPTGFQMTPVEWLLPPIGTDDDYFDGWSSNVWDMDGDGRPDMVVTLHDGPGGIGDTHWDVYLNTGSGFAAEPIAWALPPNDLEFDAYPTFTHGSTACDGGSWRYRSTRDFTNDGLADLVVTDACDQGGVGETHWMVHPNTGSGYEAAGQAWCLPPPVAEQDEGETYSVLDYVYTCESYIDAVLAYWTWDINGDGCIDLAATDDCAEDGVGLTHWLVYLNPCD